MEQKLTEETLERKQIFKGRILDFHVDTVRLENGKTASREVADHPGGVCVAVITEAKELIFVRQFRYPYGKVVLELPAGKLEPGEDPFEAMKREQLEETGTTGKNYQFLGVLYPSPGYCSEVIHLWCCELDEIKAQDLDEDEFIEVEKIPVEKAVEMVMNNEIEDAKTQTVVLKVARILGI